MVEATTILGCSIVAIVALTLHSIALCNHIVDECRQRYSEAHQAREDARLALEATLRMQVEASRARAEAHGLYENAVRHFGLLPKEDDAQ